MNCELFYEREIRNQVAVEGRYEVKGGFFASEKYYSVFVCL
jgi:hypothetical protein